MGYLNKQEPNDLLIQAVLTVLRGERFVSTEITQRLVTQALGCRSEIRNPIELLTDRELEVFQMIGKGLTTRAIASQLDIGTYTLDTHRENIKRKLCAKNAAELNRLAVQRLLEDPTA